MYYDRLFILLVAQESYTAFYTMFLGHQEIILVKNQSYQEVIDNKMGLKDGLSLGLL